MISYNYVNLITEKYNSETFLFEMKSKEEYARDKFNKRYDFKPKENSNGTVNKNNGTITVDGNEYKLNVSNKQSSSKVDGNDRVINLDNKTFKLKNKKRQDSILYHEIGHHKMHLPKQETKFKTLDHFNELFDQKLRNTLKENPDLAKSDWRHNTQLFDEIMDFIIDKYGPTIVSNTNRDDAYRYIKQKYISPKYNNHLNAFEIEADRYSANKVGDKNATKALHEYNKRSTHRKNKNINNEINIRSHAINDKKIKNNELYK